MIRYTDTFTTSGIPAGAGAQGDGLAAHLPAGAWDLQSFFENATSAGKTIGGAFLTLLGLVAVIWGATLLVKKLMANQDQTSWLKVACLILIGGALFVSGITLILDIASGGKDTIEQFGTGAMLTPIVSVLGL